MSSNKSAENDQDKLTFGLGLMALGLVIFIIAAGIYVLVPLKLPQQSEEPEPIEAAAVPTLLPTPPPTSSLAVEGPATPTIESEIPVLLPETPQESGGLPSFAAVTDAPTAFNTTIPGQPVRLIIPKLNIDTAVHRIGLQSFVEAGNKYFQWAVPSGFAAGWHETSAPLGKPGNTVLNGHNNIYGEVFRDLVDLEFGDQISLLDETGQTFTYQVQNQELVPETGQPISVRIENARWIEATADERITLISCWPYTTNDYRVIIIAKPLNQ